GKRMRTACGADGTVKDGVLKLHGDHCERVVAWSTSEGWTVKRAETSGPGVLMVLAARSSVGLLARRYPDLEHTRRCLHPRGQWVNRPAALADGRRERLG